MRSFKKFPKPCGASAGKPIYSSIWKPFILDQSISGSAAITSSTNSQTWGGTNTTGIYIGSSGIQLGKNFSVDAAGNLTAHSGTFLGAVSAGNIEYGGSDGYFNASGLLDMSIFNDKIATDAIANRNIQSASIYPSTCNSTINGYNSLQRGKSDGLSIAY